MCSDPCYHLVSLTSFVGPKTLHELSERFRPSSIRTEMITNCYKFMGNQFLSSKGVGKSCVLPIRWTNPSATLDKNLASMGPGILSSVGVGVWGKAPEAFPDSNTTLDKV